MKQRISLALLNKDEKTSFSLVKNFKLLGAALLITLYLFSSSIMVPQQINLQPNTPPTFSKVQGQIEAHEIPVYVLDVDQSLNNWVSNRDNVITGIEAAITDANQFDSANPVRLLINGQNRVIGDDGQITRISTMTQLYDLVTSPPDRAIVINTHGQVVPIPNQYVMSHNMVQPSDGQRIIKGGTLVIRAIGYETAFSDNGKRGIKEMRYRIDSGSYQLMNYRSAYQDWCVYYDTDSLSIGSHTVQVRAISESDLILYDSRSFEIYQSSGGGSCPHLYVWNGTHHVVDNNLLRKSEQFPYIDVSDIYLLQESPTLIGDNYRIAIAETESSNDLLDQVQLWGIAHFPETQIAIDPNGKILTYTSPYAPIIALDNEGNDVLDLIREQGDTAWFTGEEGDYLVADFGNLNIDNGVKLVLRADWKIMSIHVQIQDWTGEYSDVASFIPRHRWSTEIIDLTPWLPDANGDLKVRLLFTGNHKLDYIGLDTSRPRFFFPYPLRLAEANHTEHGDVRNRLRFKDRQYSELNPGEKIFLEFEAPSSVPAKLEQDFVLKVIGRYTAIEGADDLGSVPTVLEQGDPIAPDWNALFEKIEFNCRNNGWTWTDVAGVGFYYVSNKDYWPTSHACGGYIPGIEGLRSFLNDSSILIDNGKQPLITWSTHGTGFSQEGFKSTYNIPENTIYGSKYLQGDDVAFECLGYVSSTENKRCLASVGLTGTDPGNLIFCGLDQDANGNGAYIEQDDDFKKGYYASVMAIEQAKSYIEDPALKHIVIHQRDHLASFAVTLVPGSWRRDSDEHGDYVAIDLRFVTRSYYPFNYEYIGLGQYNIYYLSCSDFYAYSDIGNNRFLIDISRSGIEKYDVSGVNDIRAELWWATLGAATGVFLNEWQSLFAAGPMTLTPLLIDQFFPEPGWDPTWCAPGVRFEAGDTGTTAILIEVKCYLNTQPTNYSIIINQVSNVGLQLPGWDYPRWPDHQLFNSHFLSFRVWWN